MSGNQNQYDPSAMFREWIQKSGKAQAEFMSTFANLMGDARAFDPLETLKGISERTARTQGEVADRMASFQGQAIDRMFNFGQMLPGFVNWGAYKTAVGSNGRISIPEAERDALGLREGDLVQVIVMPVKKSRDREVKQ